MSNVSGYNVDNFIFTAESDLTAFSLRTEHFKSKQVEDKNLLSSENRPAWIKRLYDQAGEQSNVYMNKPTYVHKLPRRKRSLDNSCIPDDIELRMVNKFQFVSIYINII